MKTSVSVYGSTWWASAGAANTPIAASILAVEMFGPVIGPYAAVACVVSFLMTGHRSVYPSQVLSVQKADYIQVELGREIDRIKGANYSAKPKSVASLAIKIIQKIDDLVNVRD